MAVERLRRFHPKILVAAAFGVSMVTLGAFYDDKLKDIVGVAEDEAPLYVVPAGRKAAL